MMPGDRVRLTNCKGIIRSGLIIADSFTPTASDMNYYLVAIDAWPGDEHPVIYCAETWLTKI